ncbi:MAG: hypothetical protein AAF755_04210 [Pseudomonadota bacterium]
MRYPFTPKSTRYLLPGQFWPIELSSGRFACGRVLQTAQNHGFSDQRGFLAGLMDWSNVSPPVKDDLRGVPICEIGKAHVKTITHLGAQITDCCPLPEDAIPRRLDRAASPGCRLLRGYKDQGAAAPEDQSKLPVLGTWGYGFIVLLAERRFGSA